jgi:hypothetical protein
MALHGSSSSGSSSSLGGAAITRRGSVKNNISAASIDLTLPAGTAAGDTALIFVVGGFQAQTPSGAFVVESGSKTTTGGWESTCFCKAITSGDVTAGKVTVAMEGSGFVMGQMAVYVGAVDIAWSKCFHLPGYRLAYQASSDGYTTARLYTNDVVVMNINCGGASSSNTSSIGSQLQSDPNASGSMATYEYVLAANGMAQPVINIPTPGTKDIDMIFVALRS